MQQEGVQEDLVHALLLTLLFCLIITTLVWRGGYFQLPVEEKGDSRLRIGLLDVLGGFTLYFLLKIFMLPFAIAILDYFKIDTETGSEEIQFGWAVLLVNIIAAAGLFLYFASYESAVRLQIWGGAPRQEGVSQKLYHLFLGMSTWLIAFPWIMFNTQLINLMFQLLNIGPPIDQEAVKLLKQSSSDPWLLACMIASLVLIVPCIEELLFRGFFFCWAKGAFGRWVAIPLSAALFALFHYSSDQSYENISLLSSIFILGCFLGFLRERQRSLWAPIGLHGVFNLISSQLVLGSTLC